jgi:cell division protein ZapA
MSHINVTINGRQYRMACEEGQEVRLLKLAESLEARVEQLRGKFGEIGDQRLTVMAALTACDELLDAGSVEDLNELAGCVGPLAERLAATNGAYYRWSDSSGAEIWLQVDGNNNPVGMNPHYAGRSIVPVGLTARLPSAGPRELDGSFHGWAAPSHDAPDTGAYPLVFDTPDYRLHDELLLPSRQEVQIAAFAHEVSAFETVALYE